MINPYEPPRVRSATPVPADQPLRATFRRDAARWRRAVRFYVWQTSMRTRESLVFVAWFLLVALIGPLVILYVNTVAALVVYGAFLFVFPLGASVLLHVQSRRMCGELARRLATGRGDEWEFVEVDDRQLVHSYGLKSDSWALSAILSIHRTHAPPYDMLIVIPRRGALIVIPSDGQFDGLTFEVFCRLLLRRFRDARRGP